MAADAGTIHASAVLAGPKAVLIRGPAGSGKSQLVWDVLQAGLPFARLVADDRVHAEARDGRLLVRPAPKLAGLIEIRGLGIRRLPYEAVAAVGLVVELAAQDAARLPGPEASQTHIEGIPLPRLPVAAGQPALPLLLAFLRSSAARN
jgi:serine kinase of HPr protein (carbohydrate metabolism regulator)